MGSIGHGHNWQRRSRWSAVAFAVVLLMGGCASGEDDPAVVATTTGDAAGSTTIDAADSTSHPVDTKTAPTTAPPPDVTSSTTTAAPEQTEKEEPEPTETEQPEEPSGALVVEGQVLFTTPARAAYCRIIEADEWSPRGYVECEVQESTVPPGDPLKGVCPEGFGYYVMLRPGEEQHSFSCNYYEGITSGEFPMDSDDSWIGSNDTDTLPNGQVIGVLDYGQRLRLDEIECTVRPDGLTCQHLDLTRGFTLNTAGFSQW